MAVDQDESSVRPEPAQVERRRSGRAVRVVRGEFRRHLRQIVYQVFDPGDAAIGELLGFDSRNGTGRQQVGVRGDSRTCNGDLFELPVGLLRLLRNGRDGDCRGGNSQTRYSAMYGDRKLRVPGHRLLPLKVALCPPLTAATGTAEKCIRCIFAPRSQLILFDYLSQLSLYCCSLATDDR